ncbi:hypothetical protein CHS0354_010700 [Potamilus streckersoni]|uniref:Cadherin domain-containing protein n=1 Tax=Potamilus streckersoni TaxID=2493646 RepID=A0AAE0TD11_9BIVA|nr:hypothetical protein CHS0354_010700 [Potamilus streckersoni]
MTSMILFVNIAIFFICTVLTFCNSAETSAPIMNFTMFEELEIGTLIGSIKKQAAISNITQSNGTYEYYFFSSPQYQSLFHINRETGDLTTLVVVDRELVCEFSLKCILRFDIGINYQDGRFYKYITVQVYIEDKNDNPPLFPKQSTTLQISEGVQIGSAFRIDSPVDRDTGANNSIQGIEIVPKISVFGLRIESNLDESVQVKIIVNGKLDRETQDFYQLIVVARDGGVPPLSGSLTVNISVLDVNDNKPEFSNTTYKISVNETTPPNSVILTLSATDVDIGENGRVTYRISDHQSDADRIKTMFAVDAQSGELQTKIDVVNEQGNSYTFIVEAVDNGVDPLVSQSQVIVNIIDSENNAPIVSLVPSVGGNLRFINISESATLGTFVANLEIIDTDSGQNGNISCMSSSSLFSVDYLGSTRTLKRFIVMVNGLLDRETQDVHNVTIICFDHGSPRLSSVTNFLVRVTDKNDNKPLFKSENYVGYIPENNDINAVILQVSATDQDIGNNGLVQYHIHEDGQRMVTIGINNGIIYAATVFDREANESFIFRILAIDLGSQALTGTATVTLYIEDKNDQVPTFVNTANPFEILENLPSDSSVGYLKAKDEDIGINAQLSFAMLEGYLYTPFVVFKNGLIKTNKELDREQQSRYDFQVMVIDQGQPSLSSISNVTVFVTDTNDNAPRITYPSEKNNTISVPYPDEQNTFVCQIQAYDSDEGVNSILVYGISAGNDLGIFGIDENLGHVFVQNVVNIDSDMKVSLTIHVKDKGKITLSSSATLNIGLIYSNFSTLTSIASDNDSKYIIISVVVVLATVLISGAIIGVIFFLRHLDGRKHRPIQEQSPSESDFGFQLQLATNKPLSTKDIFKKGSDSRTEKHNEQNKNDVNLIVTNSYDHLLNGNRHISLSDYSTLQMEFDTDGQPRSSSSYSNTRSSLLLEQDKSNTQLKNIKVQRMMSKTHAKQWVQEQQLHQQQSPGHLEDSHSHSSGETIPSDSGKGGSEEDMSSVPASADDHKVFDFPQTEIQSKCPEFLPTVSDRAPYSQDLYRQLKRPCSSLASPYTHSAKSRDNITSSCYHDRSLNRYYVNRPFRDLRKSSSWRNSYVTTHSPLDFTGDSSVNSFFENTGTLQSRDDDDGSTTTSGSYTLYPEEIL